MDDEEVVPQDRVPVAPEVLVWARESAGVDLAEAARRISPSVEKWEAGELYPTVKQLRAAAKLYGRPLAVMLLSTPPREFLAIRDFRRLPDEKRQARWSRALHAAVKRGHSQREVILELAEISPTSVVPSVELPSIQVNSSPEEVGRMFRTLLRLDSVGWRVWSDATASLNTCVDAVEDLGILVIHTQKVDANEMLGFSISEWPYPVIALNGSDVPRRRLYTLLHELSHLSLSVGGLCDLHEVAGKRDGRDDVEHFCNQVAAAALMPAEAILADPLVRSGTRDRQWTLEELTSIARGFGASTEALLLRLITFNKATWDLYWTRKPELEVRYREARLLEQERRRVKKNGPSYYVVKARDLGHTYVHSVLDAFHSRAISSLDVADYLEVPFDRLSRLQAAART